MSFSQAFPIYKEVQPETLLKSEQDGLFFGLKYLQETLTPESFSKIRAYFSDGNCVFTDQIILSIDLQETNFETEKLKSAISYLSGVYTLVSCFTEKTFDFSICASLTPDFELAPWEEQAILKAGAVIRPFPTKLLSLKETQKELNKRDSAYVLSEFKISRNQIKEILKTESSSTCFDLHGSFLTSELEEFREFNNINSVYSVYLQGSFPCLPMKFSQ